MEKCPGIIHFFVLNLIGLFINLENITSQALPFEIKKGLLNKSLISINNYGPNKTAKSNLYVTWKTIHRKICPCITSFSYFG